MTKGTVRFLSLVGVLLSLGGALVFAAGAQEQSTTSAALGQIGFNASGFPIVSKPVTFKILARRYSPIKDFIENDFTKWYQEKTNVQIDWDLVPDADVGTKVSVVLASGDYPEAFMVPWGISLTQQMVYGSQGVFLPLNDLIEKYGLNYKKMLAEYPLMRDLITMADGKIYTMPNLDNFYEGMLPDKMWIWQPWLDALKLKVPTTTEELYTVLKAFKERDPNGNGKADEIPLSGNLSGGKGTPVTFLMNAFTYAGGENYTVLKDGKIDYAFDEPAWRDGIRYMKRLFDAGLLAKEVFTQDANTFRQANAKETLTGCFVDLAPWRAFPELYGNDRWMGWKPVPSLTGPSGLRVATYLPYSIGWFDGLILTSAAKHPEVAFRWGEAMYDQEITLRKYYGRPDEEWRYAKSGEVGINGKPAIWATLAKSGGEVDVPTPHSWMHVGPHFRSADFRNGQVVSGDVTKNPNASLYRYTIEAGEPFKADAKMIVPPLVYTEQQSGELGSLQKTINDYVYQMTARFITGGADIESGWDAYITELGRMNLKRYQEIMQTAYQTKYKR